MPSIADYKKWLTLNKQLREVKNEEASLRAKLVQEIFHGMITPGRRIEKLLEHSTGKQYIVKATNKMSYTVDDIEVRSMWRELTEQEKKCIKIKFDLVMSEYNKLSDDCLLKEAVTKRPVLPDLEVSVL